MKTQFFLISLLLVLEQSAFKLNHELHQDRGTLCFDICLKSLTVHGTIKDPRGNEVVTSEACDKSLCGPFSKRRCCLEPFSPQAPPSCATHIGFDRRFINKHQPVQSFAHRRLAIVAHVSATLLRSQQRFL